MSHGDKHRRRSLCIVKMFQLQCSHLGLLQLRLLRETRCHQLPFARRHSPRSVPVFNSVPAHRQGCAPLRIPRAASHRISRARIRGPEHKQREEHPRRDSATPPHDRQLHCWLQTGSPYVHLTPRSDRVRPLDALHALPPRVWVKTVLTPRGVAAAAAPATAPPFPVAAILHSRHSVP